MNIHKQEFIQLIDQALNMAKQMDASPQGAGNSNAEGLKKLIPILQTLKSQVLEDTLEASVQNSTLGLAREVADWITPLDSPLLSAVGAIEAHYQIKA
jgi:hypothetical protein